MASSRLSSLDGLRGVAALIVVVHHSLLVSPNLAAAYYEGEVEGLAANIVTYSPLHLLWGGKEAVIVFFVLSGLVLVLAMRSIRFDWFSYFPSRMIRLYLPIVGAVALTALILLIPVGDGPASPWLDRPGGYSLESVLRDLTLIGGNSRVISPLWSLRWEVLFSLLLPVVAYALRLIPGWLFGLICLGLSAVGAWQGVAAVQYLPMFGVGAAIGGEWNRIERWADAMSERRAAMTWPALLALALLMLSSYWMARGVLPYEVALVSTQALLLAGAGLLVIVAANWRPIVRALSSRPITLLGAMSFSLYLIHEPIIIATASIVESARMTLLIGVPLSVLIAWLFWLVIERPSHRLARRVRDHAHRVAERDAMARWEKVREREAHTPTRELTTS